MESLSQFIEKIFLRPPFFKTRLKHGAAALCIDGRMDPKIESKGPHMPGGSAFPVILSAFYEGHDLDKHFADLKMAQLKTAGYSIGVHQDEHSHNPVSGCFALDHTENIIQTVVYQHRAIKQQFLEIYDANKTNFDDLSHNLPQAIDNFIEKVQNSSHVSMRLAGEDFIMNAKENHLAQVGILKGDHKENAYWINLDPNYTFNTNKANDRGKPAFDLDPPAARDQAVAVGVDADFAVAGAIVMYLATRLAIGKINGKIPPVFVNK